MIPRTRRLTFVAFLAVVDGACQSVPPSELARESFRVHAIIAKDAVKPAGVPADFVATPLGFFHPSCLVHVNSNLALTPPPAPCAYPRYNVAGQMMTADSASATAADAGALPSRGSGESAAQFAPVPQAVSNDLEGWILGVSATYPAGVSKLTARWTVPPTPPQAGQTLFFFPGTESLDGKPGGTILQPVLAYENAQWFVQSWNCCEGGGNAQFGDAVSVSPGDTIVGTNIGTNCDDSTGICNNWRVMTVDATTGGQSVFDTLSFGHPHQWVFSDVMEVYNVKSCDQLPKTGGLTYHDLAVWDMHGQTIDVPSLNFRSGEPTQLSGCGGTWSGSQLGTDSMISWGGPRGGGNNFSTGFESVDTQPTWRDTIDWSSNVSGYFSSINPECSVRTEEQEHSGSSALMYSGTANGGSATFAYFKVFSVDIPVSSATMLDYWIYPQQDNGRYVAVDFHCTDGTTLRDSGAVDQTGFSVHPAAGHGGNIPLNAWSEIRSNVGAKLAGKTVDKIWVAYDRPGSTGQFRGYIDDLSITY